MRKKTGKIWIAALACIGMMIASVCGLKVSAAENRGTSEPVLEYIVINNPRIDTPGTQIIVAGYQAKDTLTDAVLTYKNTVTDEEMTVSAARIDADTAVFEMNYTDESESGIYSLESLDFEMDEQMYSLDFAKCGIEGKYGVNQSCETEPDAVVEDSDTQEETNDSDVSFTTITKDGEVTENADISDVVEEAVAQRSSDSEIAVYAESGARTTSTGKVIVVLDPGHGGFDPGTSGFGANEKDLTLKIAKYCKAALEKDGRIQVYMTRETDTSVGNTTNVSTDLYNRIQYAIGKKANLFVSIHLNSATASAKGAEVYYPNSNYRADIGAQGKALATDIQNELVKLGLYNRGAKIQNSTSSKYPDNSVQDYYYVIQQSKRAGFPGIIVEHAYLSNQSDYNNYLSSDAKLKKLGEADAKGIITYLDTSGYVGKWVQSGSQWKYQNYDGSYVKNCWKLIKNLWYHFDANGIMQTGFLTLNGKMYYLQSSGAMKTGWQKISNTWYYFDSSGAMVSNGWRWINSKCYYFDKNGKMAADTWIGEYYVDASGAWVKDKQKETDKWIQSSGRWWYRHADGSYTRSGWEYIGGKWYYFDQNGWMVTGWQKVKGSWYYMESNGAMVSSGWKWINSKCYYFDKNGKMAANTWIDGSYVDASGAWVKDKKQEPDKWIRSSGRWWYRHGDGTYIRSDWEYIGNKWYYFDQNGWMITGWQKVSGSWYYMEGNGARVADGWKWINNKCYYFDKNGKMAVDTWIDGSYVDASGVWIKDKKQEPENVTKTGWVQYSGHWMYYNTDGSYVKSNWKSVNSIWYYFDQNGWMVTGWMTLSSGKYYLNPTKNSDGVEGAMLKGYKQIDGKWYYLRSGESPEGSLRYEGVTSIMGTSAMGTNKTTVVNKMVKMFQKSGKNYPTQALTKGNAPTIEAFCRIVYDEAVIEGIKPEVVFGQAMNETGYLQFGGDVKIEQFNFAGLGASGGGIVGESFKSVAEGIRAQVQHLKGYASTKALKQTCVDNRYKWVTKGCAPYVEWLGQKENPNGKGWATSKNYGMNLMEKYIIPMYSL
ncbi:N-acetylmuramoyl-L-alanine amidase [Dorea longicatena]|uniref:N-acetylmuramoyl-L-alanine amidase n=1 Tax=Dorea longicatena TaxID=88431 RepID=UPI0032BFEF40